MKKCNLCNGTGKRTIITKTSKKGQYSEIRTCEKCGGCGKLDWIEMITGKPNVKVHTESLIFNSK